MAVKEITIKEAIKSPDGKWLNILAEDGDRYSGHPPDLPDLSNGGTWNIEFESKPKRNKPSETWNSASRMWQGNEPQKADTQSLGKTLASFRPDNPEQRASIEAQTAFKGIVELMVAGRIEVKHPLWVAARTWAIQAFKQVGIEIQEVKNEASAPQASQPEAAGTDTKGKTTAPSYKRPMP